MPKPEDQLSRNKTPHINAVVPAANNNISGINFRNETRPRGFINSGNGKKGYSGKHAQENAREMGMVTA
jgi:hypothetical protein